MANLQLWKMKKEVETPFIGRSTELKRLLELKKKTTSSLIVIRGRRRIGKSRLAEEFGKTFDHFIEIQGLGPANSSNNQDQLNHFSNKLSEIFNSKKEVFEDWSEAFHSLANKVKKGKYLILLDEISWMGRYDPLFSAKLKEAWDTSFKKNNNLNLILCGSVSFWIEEHIIKNQVFEGRVSLDLFLEELTLREINNFWSLKSNKFGLLEKMLILSVTGGVPKYLEEIIDSETAEQNIIRLCFQKGGFLFEEYDKIFKEIFQAKAKTLDKIVRLIVEKKLSPVEISKKLHQPIGSFFSNNLHILEISGFIFRDYTFKPDGSISKISYFRLKDNYLRFYLKYIEPLKPKIERGGKTILSLKDLPNFDGIMGLQFENLVLANRSIILELLNINSSQVVTAAPYFQPKNSKTKAACQVDLLIHTTLDVFYLCEIKFQKIINISVIKEIEKKSKALKLPRRSALKKILIYEGSLDENHRTSIEEYFFRIISFQEILEGPTTGAKK